MSRHGSRSNRLLVRLSLYYLGLSGLLLIAFLVWPNIRDFLPIGGVEALLSRGSGAAAGPLDSVRLEAAGVGDFGGSLMWMVIAILGSLIAALPVSWTYMAARAKEEYNQSLVETIILLPMIVSSIVIVVHNSLALAFSIAGIAAGVQFRNALKSPGDALFILLSIGIGLSSGIGALELAIVMGLAFNFAFLILWINDYGAQKGTHRYLRKDRGNREDEAATGVDDMAPALPSDSDPRREP